MADARRVRSASRGSRTATRPSSRARCATLTAGEREVVALRLLLDLGRRERGARARDLAHGLLHAPRPRAPQARGRDRRTCPRLRLETSTWSMRCSMVARCSRTRSAWRRCSTSCALAGPAPPELRWRSRPNGSRHRTGDAARLPRPAASPLAVASALLAVCAIVVVGAISLWSRRPRPTRSTSRLRAATRWSSPPWRRRHPSRPRPPVPEAPALLGGKRPPPVAPSPSSGACRTTRPGCGCGSPAPAGSRRSPSARSA